MLNLGAPTGRFYTLDSSGILLAFGTTPDCLLTTALAATVALTWGLLWVGA